ncbi:villin-1-like isoform X2 [Biomphalaria glabrata]
MECSALAITDDNAIILDGYPRVYVCIGKNVDFILREKTLQLAKLINDQHGAERSQIIVMDENDEHLKKRFATKLDPNLPCYRQSSEEIFDEVIPQESLQLFKINGSRAEYDMPLVSSYPLHQKYLTSQGIFLLKVKTTQPVYIWVGQCADSFAISEALLNGQMFMQTHHFPASTPLCRVRENEEPIDFKKYFKDWKDKIHHTPSKAVHTYTVANIERALLSNCETQIIGKLKEIQKEVNVLECSKDYEVWLIDEHLIPLKTTSYPAFDRSHCYLILCHRTNGENKNCVLYYWMGERASSEKKKLALSVTLQCQSFLSNNCLMIRVLEGKEPKHFLTVLNSCLIVYDGGPNQDISTSDMNLNFENNVIIFCVRECHEDLVTVSQVQSSSKCLNSSATFVVMSRSQKYLWYGKNSTVLERDYAKHMMNHFCPERLHDYIIVGEDREPDQFWTCVLKHGEHLDQFPPKSLCCGEPRLIMCNQSQEKWLFNDIYDFCHENLYESAIYILDTRDCILLWIGQSINEVTQDMISSIFSAYLSIDLTNRQESDIEIWILHQSNEPFLFSNMFGDICFKYAKIMYQLERKRLRIENALINLSRQEENADSSIDMQHLKLPDSEFHAVFRMRKSVFHHLPRVVTGDEKELFGTLWCQGHQVKEKTSQGILYVGIDEQNQRKTSQGILYVGIDEQNQRETSQGILYVGIDEQNQRKTSQGILYVGIDEQNQRETCQGIQYVGMDEQNQRETCQGILYVGIDEQNQRETCQGILYVGIDEQNQRETCQGILYVGIDEQNQRETCQGILYVGIDEQNQRETCQGILYVGIDLRNDNTPKVEKIKRADVSF